MPTTSAGDHDSEPRYQDHWIQFCANRQGQHDYGGLTEGPGLVVLEALQPDLAERFEAVERFKGGLADAADLINLKTTQKQALQAYLMAIDRAGRRDLAGFLVHF